MTLARREFLLMAGVGGLAPLPGETGSALAQGRAVDGGSPKRGGTLRLFSTDTPASMSPLEETTISVIVPTMPVFNNLVLFDQQVPQNSPETIRPELATRWQWGDDHRSLTFTLREGVRWHDGRPFSSADVVHTFALIQGRAGDSFRLNPRRAWYTNVQEVTASGPNEVVFRLGRPQPSLLSLLASAMAPIYPAHVPAREMRQRPIGTGPFRFIEYRRGEHLKLARNPHYWKPDRPLLDAIEQTVIPARATALLGFVTGRFDMTGRGSVSIPLMRDIQAQVPDATIQLVPLNVAASVCMNVTAEPFSNPQLRRAVQLMLDRDEFIAILAEGRAPMGGAMLPPPHGVWGLPPEVLATLPGYGPDLPARREEARRIMAGLGYGPNSPMPLKVTTRNWPVYRDPAVILISQLKSIWIEGTLETVETAQWDSRMQRKQYAIALNLTGSAVDDPDQQWFENYSCDSLRNYTGYCDPELERLFVAQSQELDPARRLEMVREIDRRIQDSGTRPILYHLQSATAWHPRVKGISLMVNSQYNGWRMEDVWLDV